MKLLATWLRCFWECARLPKHRSIDLPRNIFMVGPRWSVSLSNYVLFAKLLYSEYTSADGAISRLYCGKQGKKSLNWYVIEIQRNTGRLSLDPNPLGPVCEELYPNFVCTLIPGFLYVAYRLVPTFEALNLCGQKARAMLFRVLNTVPNRDDAIRLTFCERIVNWIFPVLTWLC